MSVCKKCGGVVTETSGGRLYCRRCGPQSGPRQCEGGLWDYSGLVVALEG